MHKKLMVAAVAGALAAPAMALAQTTIYGLFNAEWSPVVDQPNTGSAVTAANPTANAPRHDGEGFNSGASRIGFRGEEKLGGGLTAWYQCETELGLFPDDRGVTVCDRNSALGIRGDFGNFYVGTWDSPIKRASGVTRITNETGWLGSQDLTLRDAGTGSPNFSNRNVESFNYDTPRLGALSGSFQITTTQATLNATSATPAIVAEGRRMGLSGQYAAGPITVVAAYAVHDENQSTTGGAADEDTAWLIGGTYVWNQLKVGFTYTNREAEVGALSTDRKAWNLAGEYSLGGPGMIRVGYAQADDLKGSAALGAAANSGAKQYQISYLHAFSKRTTGTVGYVKLDNDSNGTWNLTDQTSGPASATSPGVFPGSSASAFVLSLSHSF